VARAREAAVEVGDVDVTEPGGGQVPLPVRSGVTVLVLMRHRH
jgi:hypothetical protein